MKKTTKKDAAASKKALASKKESVAKKEAASKKDVASKKESAVKKDVAASKKGTSSQAIALTKVNMRISSKDKESLRDFAKKNKMTYSTCIDALLKLRWSRETEMEATGPLANKRKPKCDDFSAVKDSFIVFTMATVDKKKLQKAAAKEGISASMYLRKTIFR